MAYRLVRFAPHDGDMRKEIETYENPREASNEAEMLNETFPDFLYVVEIARS